MSTPYDVASSIIEFMYGVFPRCPICGAEANYEASGFLKNYVACRVCKAKWSLERDCMKLVRLPTRIIELYSFKDIALRNLLGLPLHVKFWVDLELDKIKTRETLGKFMEEHMKLYLVLSRREITPAWYLIPILGLFLGFLGLFLGILAPTFEILGGIIGISGGIFGYLAVKNQDLEMANNLLIVGLIVASFDFILAIIFWALIFHQYARI
jgi:hypothetical protein